MSLKSLNKLAEASHKDLTYTIWRKKTYPHDGTIFKLPALVCKQFHHEATAALYASSAFEISDPHCFRAFALSPHACVAQLHRLVIPRLTHHWGEALTASLVGRLSGLRGVRLTHEYLRCIETRPIPRATDAEWKGFWRMVRAFQQHGLEPRQTRFEVVVYNIYKNRGLQTGPRAADTVLGPGESEYGDVLRLQEELTEGLLRYAPRRLSRRGAGRV